MKVSGISSTDLHYGYQRKKVNFKANPVGGQIPAAKVLSLLTAGCVTIITALKRGEMSMNEIEKFIDVREDFSKEAEPANI